MLIQATAEDIARYADFAYNLALNPATSSYPTYCDGIKTKADFLAAAERAVSDETSDLLLFVVDAVVEGWLHYYWLPDEQCLQLTGFSVLRAAEQAMAELLERLKAKFPGYTLYFGFPGENRAATNFLEAHGFRCIEQDWNHTFFFDSYSPVDDSSCIERITQENFDQFRTLYHADPETYWNAERIYETLDDWLIFAYKQAERPAAAIFLTGKGSSYEIFGTVFADGVFQETMLRDLLRASLNACKCKGATHLTCFCAEQERPVLRELGFHCVGQYVLYIRTI